MPTRWLLSHLAELSVISVIKIYLARANFVIKRSRRRDMLSCCVSRHAAAESAIAIKTAARHVGGHGSGMA